MSLPRPSAGGGSLFLHRRANLSFRRGKGGVAGAHLRVPTWGCLTEQARSSKFRKGDPLVNWQVVVSWIKEAVWLCRLPRRSVCRPSAADGELFGIRALRSDQLGGISLAPASSGRPLCQARRNRRAIAAALLRKKANLTNKLIRPAFLVLRSGRVDAIRRCPAPNRTILYAMGLGRHVRGQKDCSFSLYRPSIRPRRRRPISLV